MKIIRKGAAIISPEQKRQLEERRLRLKAIFSNQPKPIKNNNKNDTKNDTTTPQPILRPQSYIEEGSSFIQRAERHFKQWGQHQKLDIEKIKQRAAELRVAAEAAKKTENHHHTI